MQAAGRRWTLLDGRTLRARGNTNIAYFSDPAYDRRFAAAERLAGRERGAAYARLATDLARQAAPLVALAVPVRQDFFSARVGCKVYQPVYGIDLAALCVSR